MEAAAWRAAETSCADAGGCGDPDDPPPPPPKKVMTSETKAAKSRTPVRQ